MHACKIWQLFNFSQHFAYVEVGVKYLVPPPAIAVFYFSSSMFLTVQVIWCVFAPHDYPTIGADGDDDKIELLLSEVKGKDITELIASGREKLAPVPSGGGGVVVAAAASGGGAAAAPAAEAKKD
ncbi:hypothetical protein POM88_020722 [Heracleum sosnowskyi]|uniref:Uncharacterized protein n=1 Tax=Heracleum sosnowskyi TaxID=360622 RepID=A0AAD8IBX6_9APIA|nr:hypothetical protein POM88_020722 [Heracleum sosnowskyi]